MILVFAIAAVYAGLACIGAFSIIRFLEPYFTRSEDPPDGPD